MVATPHLGNLFQILNPSLLPTLQHQQMLLEKGEGVPGWLLSARCHLSPAPEMVHSGEAQQGFGAVELATRAAWHEEKCQRR